MSQFEKNCHSGRDPWFDRPFDKLTVLSRVEGLTTLSEVDPPTQLRVDAEQGRSIEGESRKGAENQIILDPGSHPAPRDLAGMTNYDTAFDEGRLTRHSSLAGKPLSVLRSSLLQRTGYGGRAIEGGEL